MLGSSTFKYLIASIQLLVCCSDSRVGKEQSLETRGLRFGSRSSGFFTQKINFFKIEDKLSSKNLSPEIAVNYCKTVQVSVNHG